MKKYSKTTATCLAIGLSLSGLGYSSQATSFNQQEFNKIQEIINKPTLEARQLTLEDTEYLNNEISNLLFEETNLDEQTVQELTSEFVKLISATRSGDAIATYGAAKDLSNKFQEISREQGTLEKFIKGAQQIFAAILKVVQAVISGDLSGIVQAVIEVIVTFISLITR